MNLSAYCQQLELGNKGATLNGETWVCIHADNTTAALNLQAACEHEYKVRPIKAEEITPGVPFSWKCFQTTVKEVEEEAAKGGSGSATTTTVSCNLDFTTLLETCTATVVGGKTPPTGTVTFSSAAGGGVFTFGNTCTLTPGGPGTPNASCHVAYIPPSKTLTLISSVAISAVYGGDGTHQDSSSRTSLLASQQAAVESAASGSGSFNASEALSHGGLPYTVSAEIPGTLEINAVVASSGSGGTLPILKERTGNGPEGGTSAPPILKPPSGTAAIESTGLLAINGTGATLPVLRKPEATGATGTLPIILLPPRASAPAWTAAAHKVKLVRIAHVRVKITRAGKVKVRAALNKEGRRLAKRIITLDRAYARKHKGKNKGTPPVQYFVTGILYTPGA